MTAIKNNVDEMDEKVQLAEKQLGNKNLKKILNSIPIPQYFAVSSNTILLKYQVYFNCDQEDTFFYTLFIRTIL